jgi:hypothetical protein
MLAQNLNIVDRRAHARLDINASFHLAAAWLHSGKRQSND